MSKFLRAAFVMATFVAAGASQAVPVAMYGEYREANGIIVNIPQNPPTVICVPAPVLVAPPGHLTIMGAAHASVVLPRAGVNDAGCPTRSEHFAASGGVAPLVFNKPLVGTKGARSANGGMAIGDPFTVPPFAFQQQLGKQVGVVLNNVTKELETTFIAAMPGTDRRSGMGGGFGVPFGPYTIRPVAAQAAVPALTRMFSQMNWQNAGNGQNNNANPTAMLPTPFVQRLAANTTHFNSAALGNEKVQMRYRSGPREFGGTMALLLDGSGKLILGGPPITGMLPASFKPGAATQPVGDQVPGYRVRNADGWDVVAAGFQAPGRVKAFFGNVITPMGLPRIGPDCVGSNPPTPVGCNHVAGFDTFMAGAFTTMTLMIPAGGTIGALPKATSLKHAFALTTGTASVVQVANRALQGGVQTRTLTGMGYDTIGVSQMGAPQRNVGLVAGSYSVRTSFPPAGPDIQINPQMLGLNLKFTPEPGATVALVSGLGLLGFLARRRA